MSYEKQIWATGDIISAQKLNKIEQGIVDNEPGHEYIVREDEIYNDSVASTQFYNGAYVSDAITISQDNLNSDVTKVIFNGVEYQVSKKTFYSIIYYGALFRGSFTPQSFSEYPFCLVNNEGSYIVAVKQSGTNEIIIFAKQEIINTNESFEKSVKKFIPKNIKDGINATSVIENNISINNASGSYSHAEGSSTEASGECSHAEGGSTTASGTASHAEGGGTTASGDNSHAEGRDTTASGQYSHAEGQGTIANHKSQHVFGEYNIEDSSSNTKYNRGTYIEIVGNGGPNGHSNARTLDWSGNERLTGSLTLGAGTANEITITPQQLKQLINSLPVGQ